MPKLFFGVVLSLLLGMVPTVHAEPVILAFGDSLTYGFEVKENESYPARLQKILREEGYPHKVVNAGVNGDTTTGGASRIDWLLQHNPEIVIVELGANDGLRGLPVDEMKKNLSAIIEACKKKNSKVLLAGMKIPPNYGQEYTDEFEQMYEALARQHDVPLLPFFLEDVAAKRELTLPDGIHPVSEGYAIVTLTVWKYLKPMLKK